MSINLKEFRGWGRPTVSEVWKDCSVDWFTVDFLGRICSVNLWMGMGLAEASRDLGFQSNYIVESHVHLWSLVTASPHLISQFLNIDGRRGTTDDIAAVPFHLCLSSAAARESPDSIPVHFYVIFPSLLLSSFPSCPFYCPLHNCLRHARGSWDVAIWVFVSSPWLEDHHVLQLHSGFCCEPWSL